MSYLCDSGNLFCVNISVISVAFKEFIVQEDKSISFKLQLRISTPYKFVFTNKQPDKSQLLRIVFEISQFVKSQSFKSAL